MKSTYNPDTLRFKVEDEICNTFDVPESATLTQLKEFKKVMEGISINPNDLISVAFERIFNDAFIDDADKDAPNLAVA